TGRKIINKIKNKYKDLINAYKDDDNGNGDMKLDSELGDNKNTTNINSNNINITTNTTNINTITNITTTNITKNIKNKINSLENNINTSIMDNSSIDLLIENKFNNNKVIKNSNTKAVKNNKDNHINNNIITNTNTNTNINNTTTYPNPSNNTNSNTQIHTTNNHTSNITTNNSIKININKSMKIEDIKNILNIRNKELFGIKKINEASYSDIYSKDKYIYKVMEINDIFYKELYIHKIIDNTKCDNIMSSMSGVSSNKSSIGDMGDDNKSNKRYKSNDNNKSNNNTTYPNPNTNNTNNSNTNNHTNTTNNNRNNSINNNITVRLYDYFYCKGKYLIDAFMLYKDNNISYNAIPIENKYYGVIKMEDGGIAVENYKFKNKKEVLVFLKILINKITILEKEYQMEHRDLHLGNILIKRYNNDVCDDMDDEDGGSRSGGDDKDDGGNKSGNGNKEIGYKNNNKNNKNTTYPNPNTRTIINHTITNNPNTTTNTNPITNTITNNIINYKISIIDFSLTRIKINNNIIYNNLCNDINI
ncbi:hypothetical protein SLOPH_1020, partial [Spraguea lophii 42_110]